MGYLGDHLLTGRSHDYLRYDDDDGGGDDDDDDDDDDEDDDDDDDMCTYTWKQWTDGIKSVVTCLKKIQFSRIRSFDRF